ncbi:NAD-binding protein [Croceicoccus marinus]|uniref:NAD-binding protein n=1 Tax=Croceicoccus marinus TaxID=450378 RepID=UPI0018DFD833|nr:NAD-binding protein [Croceicoccus marinus]
MKWRDRGFDAVYGDVSDPHFVAELPLKSAEWVISTLQHHGPALVDQDPRLTMMRTLKADGFKGKIAIAVYRHSDVEHVEGLGADVILEPFEDAAQMTVNEIESSFTRIPVESS